MSYTRVDPMPVEVVAGNISVDTAGLATEATSQLQLAALNQQVTGVPATVPEPVLGPQAVNGVLAVKVGVTGASTTTIEALDASNRWNVVGWALTLSAAMNLTFSMDDDDASTDFVLKFLSGGYFSERPGSFAWFSGNIGEPFRVLNSAGNVDGVIYVRKSL